MKTERMDRICGEDGNRRFWPREWRRKWSVDPSTDPNATKQGKLKVNSERRSASFKEKRTLLGTYIKRSSWCCGSKRMVCSWRPIIKILRKINLAELKEDPCWTISTTYLYQKINIPILIHISENFILRINCYGMLSWPSSEKKI